MTTIMVFGDSNSYGTPAVAGLDEWARFAPGERWPGVMLAGLIGHDSVGPDVVLIEECLPGRTTVHDDPIEGRHKNGLAALPVVLESHRPIGIVIIMLGTNDLKARFAVSPEDIAYSVEVLVKTVRASQAGPGGTSPKVLVVVPPVILEAGCLAGFFRGGAGKSAQFGACFATMAERIGVPLLDAGPLISSNPLDGIHLALDQHAALGRAVAAAVEDLL